MQDRLDLEGLAQEPSETVLSKPRKAHVRQARIFRQTSDESLMVGDLRALVPEGDASIWIREGLERVDLSSLEDLYGDCGGVPYGPRGILGLLLYAYHEGDSGSRTIEKRCLRDVGYMHVGYGQKPDSRTIRRFRRLVGPALDEVFRQVVLACKEEGLVTLRRVAVDGTKISSAASQVTRWLTALEKEDVEAMGLEPPECSDPDARKLGSSGRFVLGYNCQTAVDCDSGIAVAVDVCNVSSDGHLLAPMVKEVVRNAEEAPAEVVADAGYDTNEGASTCASLDIEAFIAPQSPVATFWSVTEDDEIVCPMGNVARPMALHQTGGKTYRPLRVVGCHRCPFVKECCGTSGYRGIAFPEGCDPIERLNAAYRARSPEGKEAMRERMATIEAVFADIKWNKGLNRFKLRTLAGARIEWTLEHMARNLAKLGKALRGFALLLFRLWTAPPKPMWMGRPTPLPS